MSRLRIALLASLLFIAGCTPTSPGSPTPEAPPPSATDTNTFTVERSTFDVSYRLDAAVAESKVVLIDVPTGIVFRAAVQDGRQVRAGDLLGRRNPAPSLVDSAGSGTVDRSRVAAAKGRQGSVKAPVAGTFVAGARPGVKAAGLDVVTDLTPLQVLRYEGMHFRGQASVETVLGERKVACSTVWLARSEGSKSGGQVHCRLPNNVETAPGVPAVLTLTEPAVEGVLAIPLIYVGLDAAGEDYIVRVLTPSAVQERSVTVGITDGVRRIVTGGLNPGDVLQPVDS